MKKTLSETDCELLIIGTGMAGMAAALFAANRNISVVQAGAASELSFASGLIDLIAVLKPEERRIHHDPWQTIEQLRQINPVHPYAKIPTEDIREALSEFTVFLQEANLPYCSDMEKNVDIVTPAGTVKTTFLVPQSMWDGVLALQSKAPCLLVDFNRLKGFSAKQIKENLKPVFPIETVRVTFPGSTGEIYTEHMAKALENPTIRNELVQILKPHIGHFKYIGLPAVLGLHRSSEVLQNLKNQLNVGLFEIPTIPPSVPGIRLKEMFEIRLPEKGVKALHQQKVFKVTRRESGRFLVEVGQNGDIQHINAKGIILASGRFFGRGLSADRKRIKESIFNLPVVQPKERREWHHKDIFDPRGQPINRSGLNVDNRFRPLAENGQPTFENLFAAGSILAHQDWMREKSGSGIAIATAYAAVQSFLKGI